MNRELVPGATTVTTGARYYTLHAAVALEANRRGLTEEDRLSLLRRCEVVVGAVSIMDADPRLPGAHGIERLSVHLGDDGDLDVAAMSRPERAGYGESRAGYSGQYQNSERLLGLLSGLGPGPRANADVLDAGFDGLFRAAATDVLARSELEALGHLSLRSAATTADGEYLARLFCGLEPATEVAIETADRVRRSTVRTLARAMQLAPGLSPFGAMRQSVCVGATLAQDPVLSEIDEAWAWRGSLWRRTSVGSWRRLWAAVVDQVDYPMTETELSGRVAERFEQSTVRTFLDTIPDITGPDGYPSDAEALISGSDLDTIPAAVATLVVGCLRARSLSEDEPRTVYGMLGTQRRALDPLWLADWIDERTDYTIDAFVQDLVDLLVDRAFTVAMSKTEVRSTGLWSPCVLERVNGRLVRVAQDATANVGSRIEQVAGLLTALGIVDPGAEDPVTDRARDWLDLP